MDVEIFRPGGVPVGLAVTAADAARVRPLQVTVTAPAAREAPVARVSVMTFDCNDVTTAVDGAGMPHAVLPAFPPDIAVTKGELEGLNGNARNIPSLAVSDVEVVKATVAVPPGPTAELSCNAVTALARTAPTGGVLM